MFCGYFQSEPQRWYLRTSVRECSPLSAWPKKCGCFFPQEAPKVCCVTVTGLEDQIFQILLLSVVVSGKGNCCNSCQSAFPGAGKKPKLPVREWKGWLLFSPLFFFPLTDIAFSSFVGIRSSACLQRGISTEIPRM